MSEQSNYIPGVCNINQAEISYRRKWMYIGYATAAILFVLLRLFHASAWLTVAIIALPLFIGVIGTFQVRNKFCVSYGAQGKQNAAEGDDTAHMVEQLENRDTDKKKARSMNMQAAFISATVLLVVYLVSL